MSRHARNTLIFSSLTFLSRLTGMVRQMAVLTVLGQSRLSDSYLLAINIPVMLYEFAVGGLLSALFIPVLVRHQEEHGKDSPEAWRIANLLLGTVGLVMGFVSLLVILFAPQVTWGITFLAKESQAGAAREMVEFFVRYFAPQLLFIGVNAVLQAILNSHNAFAVTGAAPVLNNVVVITVLGLFWYGVVGTAGLALGTTAGVAAMTIMQLVALRRIGMPLRPRVDFRDPVFKTLTTLGKPMVAVSGANFLGTTLRANLLFTIPTGFTVFANCFQLIMVPYGIFAVSIATVLFPAMSRAVAAGDQAGFARTLSLGFRWTLLVMLPVAVMLSVLAEPVIRVLFERGNYSYADALVTSSFLRIYALSVVVYATVVFATRVFYAQSDTRTPAMINIGGVVLNTALNFALLPVMGVRGIALSAVISYAATTAVSLLLLRNVIRGPEARALLRATLKVGTAAALTAAVLWGALRLSEPAVVPLESGSRYPAPVARRDLPNYFLVRSPDQWSQFWDTLGSSAPAPRIDFERQTIIALLGPRSRTTTTLTLLSAEETTSGLAQLNVRVNMPPNRRELPRSLPQDAPTSPSYLLVALRPAVSEVKVAFEFRERMEPGRLARLLQAPGLLRLIGLGVLGCVVFLGTVTALRTEELVSLRRALLNRLNRRRTDRSGTESRK